MKGVVYLNIKVFLYSLLTAILLYSHIVSASAVTPENERQFGQKQFEAITRNAKTWNNQDLSRIQDTLVLNNLNKLNYKDGKHDRWLEHIYVISFPNSSNVYAGNLAGGKIIFDQGMLDFINTYRDDGYTDDTSNTRPNRPEYIYNNSMLMFIAGHEMGHYIHKDSISILSTKEGNEIMEKVISSSVSILNNPALQNKVATVLKQDGFGTQREINADIESLKLGENYTVLSSSAGAIMFINRLEGLERISPTDEKILKEDVHERNDVRKNRILNYISDISNGRVSISQNLSAKIDGKDFFRNGFAPETNEVTMRERTAFTSSQIAMAIKKNMFKKENRHITDIGITYGEEHPIINEQTVITAMKNKYDGVLIEKFKVPVSRAKDLADGKVIPTNREEEYFLYVWGLFDD